MASEISDEKEERKLLLAIATMNDKSRFKVLHKANYMRFYCRYAIYYSLLSWIVLKQTRPF